MGKLSLIAAGVAATLGAGFDPGKALAETSFNASIFLPAGHIIAYTGYTKWAERLEEESGGELKPKVFYGDALLPASANLSGLRDGIAQVTYHPATYTPSDMPEDNIIAMLALGFDDSVAAVLAQMDFVHTDPEMQARYKTNGGVYLTSFTTPLYHLICKKPINTIEDLAGVKIRVPGAVRAEWAKSVGAVPVSVPSAETYSGLEKGQLDCAALPTDDLKGMSLSEVAKYVNGPTLGIYFHGWMHAVNRDFWQGLSQEHRQLMMKVSMEQALATSVAHLERAETVKAEAVANDGVKIIPAPAEAAKSVADYAANEARAAAISAGKEKFGMADPEGLINRFMATYDKWEALLADVDKTDLTALNALAEREILSKIASDYGMY